MIKHILAIIWNQRKSNIWILSELFLASICLWFVVDYMFVLTGIMNAPLGYNIDNTYRLDFEERIPGSDNYIDPLLKETTIGEDLLVIMERIRQYPGIEAVSLSRAAQPYVATPYSDNMQFRQLYYNDTIGISTQEYRVTSSFFEVFRNKENMQANIQLVNALNSHSVILAENTVQELMKNEPPLNKIIQVGDKGDTKVVSGTCTPVRWNEYFKSYPSFYTLLSEAEIVDNVTSGNISNYELCVRVSPNINKTFTEDFTKDMAQQLSIGNLYLMDIRPSSIIRRAVVAPEESTIVTRTTLFFFIIINVFLGISGTFIFRTQRRRPEIGLRIALGSTKNSLQLLLIGEGILLLTLAMIPAILIDINMGLAEFINLEWTDFTLFRFVAGVAITYLIMAIMVIVGIWYPSRNTMKIQPAVVLHEE